jgi:iron(III) transport system substrate-binding protein
MKDVAAGRFAFGWTDTDDYTVAKLQGQPVAAVYPDAGADEIGVLYIPNSLVLIKGAKHREAGLKLIDWLLRPETEAMLAASATAQIPVRPGVTVPGHVRRPDQIGKVMAVDWGRVGREWDRWVGHLKAKFAGAAEEGGETFVLAWIIGGVVVCAVGLVVVLWWLTSGRS